MDGPAQTCSYNSFPRCHEPAVGEIPGTWSHPPWPLCETHIQPDMHPADLRHKLVRWPTATNRTTAGSGTKRQGED